MTFSDKIPRAITLSTRVDKPVLVTINNPFGQTHPLWPDPGTTGWRLWKMLEFYTGATKKEYTRKFDRIHMSYDRKWSIQAARENAAAVREKLKRKHRVVLLGIETVKAMDTYSQPIYYRWKRNEDFQYMMIPLPSVRNRIYTDPVYTLMTCSLLAELYNECQ